jgi:hypothetical protein
MFEVTVTLAPAARTAFSRRLQGATYGEIAAELGLSRQRAHQLVSKVAKYFGAPSLPSYKRQCKRCSKDFETTLKTKIFCTKYCTNLFHRGK